MRYRKLGNTEIEVSVICLGTMTFGEQNTEAEGHDQMDYAIDKGINFFDTAELYSVPGRPETQGNTDRILGSWFKKTGKRKDIILASKVTGPNPGLKYISPNLGFSRERILEAIDLGLKRLQTDYIDIYQLHWPERKTNFFGYLGYVKHDDQWQDNFGEAVATLDELVKAGKIRHWGLSNETPWGVMRTSAIANVTGAPRPLTIQNPYSLLNRSFEVGLSEISIREKISMLAYSPMAFGLLSGKYHSKNDKPTDRINQFKQLSRYNSELCHEATRQYIEIANEYGMSPATLALSFVNDRPFMTSNIIGATTIEQLKENISSVDIVLSDEILKKIDAVHAKISNPAP